MISEEDAHRILDRLEHLGDNLGVEIRYEPLGEENDTVSITSGLCVVRDLPIMIVDKRLNTKDRIKVIANELKKFDLSQVFIPPAIRQLLESQDN